MHTIVKEYKTAKGWAIFIYLSAPLSIGLLGWVLMLPFKNGDFSPNLGRILIPISIAMITIMVLGVIEIYKTRLIIGEDSISLIGIFSNKELKFDEIKGFIIGNQCVIVKPYDEEKKSIQISDYVEGRNEILHWLSQKYPDLEVENIIAEKQGILNNETLGDTREEREKKLSTARKISKVINWMGCITAAWVIFYPVPYGYSALLAMVIPIVALLAVKCSYGLIKIDEKWGSAYPSVVCAFIFPSMAIALRSLDYDIFDYSNLLILSILATVILLFLVLAKQQEFTFKNKKDYIAFSGFFLFFWAYSFGSLAHINCYYDNSDPQEFTSNVLEKESRKSRHSLTLSIWGQQKKSDKAKVSRELYDKLEIGDEVVVYFRHGKLETPWFEVKE